MAHDEEDDIEIEEASDASDEDDSEPKKKKKHKKDKKKKKSKEGDDDSGDVKSKKKKHKKEKKEKKSKKDKKKKTRGPRGSQRGNWETPFQPNSNMAKLFELAAQKKGVRHKEFHKAAKKLGAKETWALGILRREDRLGTWTWSFDDSDGRYRVTSVKKHKK